MDDATTGHRLVAVASIITNRVWQLRNEVIHANKGICFRSLSNQIAEDLDIEMDRLDPKEATPENYDSPHWHSPPLGCLKLNTHATWKFGKAVLAILAMDERADICGIWFHKLTCDSIDYANAIVILEACQVVEKLIFKNVEVETSYLVVVNAVTQRIEAPLNIARLIEDSKLF